mmetsp:Transcript_54218/g.117188  ORF Transcript_54218/g.117188 Transcript_54218/m.117188 type:complete len:657 (-) Transcript_54218:199-2169(-)
MAGYGASLSFDSEAMENLPTGNDSESTLKRRKMFRQADMNGNGIASLAECDRLVVEVLAVEGVKIMKPVINRAFHAARDIVPPVGKISNHYVDFHEFRYFLIYLKLYLDLFLMYSGSDFKVKGKYSDRRLSFSEFEAAVPRLLEWGMEPATAATLQEDPAAVFRQIDDNGGGVVLFDEFAHWALWNHLFNLDGDDDEDMEEALEVLRKQKPNLCGKDLDGIKASKAKYRADVKISGQGCLGGDSSLGGAYEKPPDGGAALAAGGDYPGGLAAWKASLARVKDAHKETAKGVQGCKNGCGQPCFGNYATCCTHCTGAEGPHSRSCIPSGYKLCENGCGHVQFGRFSTCCSHCQAAEGPHARGCCPSAEEKTIDARQQLCKKGCGRQRFRHYPTCCTHCRGADSRHAADCDERSSTVEREAPADACAPSRSRVQISFEGMTREVTGFINCDDAAEPEDAPGAGSLRIRILAGHFAPNPSSGFDTDVFDPFIKVSLGDVQVEAATVPQCLDPVWSSGNEFTFPVEPGQDTLNLEVWNSHSSWPGGPVASASLQFREIGDGEWHPRREPVFGQESGELSIELRFEPLFLIFHRAKDTPQGLSHERFRKLLQGISVAEDDIEAVISAHDKDENGVLDAEEFLAWLWGDMISESERAALKEA